MRARPERQGELGELRGGVGMAVETFRDAPTSRLLVFVRCLKPLSNRSVPRSRGHCLD